MIEPGRAASWCQQDSRSWPVSRTAVISNRCFPLQGRLLFHCRDNDQSDCRDQCEKLKDFRNTHGEPPPPAWNPDRAAHRSPLGQTVSRLTGKMYHLLRGLSRERGCEARAFCQCRFHSPFFGSKRFSRPGRPSARPLPLRSCRWREGSSLPARPGPGPRCSPRRRRRPGTCRCSRRR